MLTYLSSRWLLQLFITLFPQDHCIEMMKLIHTVWSGLCPLLNALQKSDLMRYVLVLPNIENLMLITFQPDICLWFLAFWFHQNHVQLKMAIADNFIQDIGIRHDLRVLLHKMRVPSLYPSYICCSDEPKYSLCSFRINLWRKTYFTLENWDSTHVIHF